MLLSDLPKVELIDGVAVPKASPRRRHAGRLVLDVDPDGRRIVAHDAGGARTFGPGAAFAHEAAHGLTIDLDALFAKLDRRRHSR
jgi:hypothetical protein